MPAVESEPLHDKGPGEAAEVGLLLNFVVFTQKYSTRSSDGDTYNRGDG